MKYDDILPQMGTMMKDIKDPAEAMIRVAQTAEECGNETAWLGDS